MKWPQAREPDGEGPGDDAASNPLVLDMHPDIVMNPLGPEIHCERCGVVTHAHADSTEFCLSCGLYVCVDCWRAAALRCASCAARSQRASQRGYLRPLRRWGRRLREVTRDARVLKASAITPSPWSEFPDEHAERARGMAIARLGGAILIGAASAAVVTAPGWIGRLASFGEAAEGVLVGAPSADDGGEAPQTGMDPSQSVSTAPAAATPTAATPTASPHSLLIDFNDVPMGGGIGDGWVRSIGRDEAVEVAAYPTSVDRSARLVVTDGAPVAICRSVRPTLTEVHRFSADLILDPEVPATGIIELNDAAGETVLRLNLARARTRLSSGPSPLGEAGGLNPGQWYHIDVLLDGEGGSRWRMAQLDGLPATSVEVPFEATLLASVGEICLGAEGPRGAAVNYDNLVITNE
ncbi:MAG: hypothetical protein H0U86_08220 [Chloroflexi bacterium]|nr:hypothetical protein [Chloroflexota bacterium]